MTGEGGGACDGWAVHVMDVTLEVMIATFLRLCYQNARLVSLVLGCLGSGKRGLWIWLRLPVKGKITRWGA
jgi:hypothetical protein